MNPQTIPQTIANYKIVGELGRGAMGVVYHGFDPGIGRPVAIKVIRVSADATAAENAALRQRLMREASAAGKLSHPAIVTIYQLGEQNENVFIVMEFVKGVALIHELQSKGLTLERSLGILQQVAAGLDYAHAAGVVHRDVKPANILIREDGAVKIADFGIARIMAASTQNVTQRGYNMGSPPYMSPEQVTSQNVNGRSDQFSLAVVAYEMLTGRRPFEAESVPALMLKIIGADPLASAESRAGIPKSMLTPLSKALSKNPTDRFPSCTAFIQALMGPGGPTLPTVGPSPVGKFVRPLLFSLGLLIVVVLLGMGGYWLTDQRGSPRTSEPVRTTQAASTTPARTVEQAALVKCIAEGRLDDARKLIEAGADVNAAIKDGTTPLTQAAEGSAYLPDNSAAVALLLDKGAKVDVQDAHGRTALDRAVAEGKNEAVRLLLDHKANPNTHAADGSTPLLTAVTYGKVVALRLLLDHGADIEAQDTHGNTPLQIAAEGTAYLPNNVPLVEALLAAGAKLEAQDSRGRTALYRAASEGKNDALILLLEKKADINHRANDGSTPLLEAVTFGKLETVHILLKQGAAVDLPDASQNTPLLVAAEGNAYLPNNAPLVTALLAANAKPDAADSRGRTPLWRAAEQGKVEAMQLLIDRNVDLNARANDGSTPLLAALQNGKIDAVKLLLAKGADVNQADANGTTALMIAAETSPYIRNPADVVRLLLSHGAKPDATDARGRTALARAVESKNTAVVDLLKR